MPFARSEAGHQVHYTVSLARERDAPRLLFVPSLGTAATMWEAQRQHFAPACDVCLVNNRGVGQSSAPPGTWWIEDMADDVIAVLDALGWDHIHLVGHSLGTLIVNAVASRIGPARVRSVAFVSPISVAPLARGVGCATARCMPFGVWRCSGLCNLVDMLIACDPKDRVEASLAINWPLAYLERDAHDGGPGTNRDAVLRAMGDAMRGHGRVAEATLLRQVRSLSMAPRLEQGLPLASPC